MSPANGPQRSPDGEHILGERAGGPNAAHPVTQTVSNPYLRRESGDGKLVAEKPQQATGCAVAVKFRLTNRLLME